mmetsp:Transcript_36975/g.106508  ORF Transcript_36975/g.106508 Transcript_36975/m.106508 type:complete len:317 (-) Transcript_36975:357-1307(-)
MRQERQRHKPRVRHAPAHGRRRRRHAGGHERLRGSARDGPPADRVPRSAGGPYLHGDAHHPGAEFFALAYPDILGEASVQDRADASVERAGIHGGGRAGHAPPLGGGGPEARVAARNEAARLGGGRSAGAGFAGVPARRLRPGRGRRGAGGHPPCGAPGPEDPRRARARLALPPHPPPLGRARRQLRRGGDRGGRSEARGSYGSERQRRHSRPLRDLLRGREPGERRAPRRGTGPRLRGCGVRVAAAYAGDGRGDAGGDERRRPPGLGGGHRRAHAGPGRVRGRHRHTHGHNPSEEALAEAERHPLARASAADAPL